MIKREAYMSRIRPFIGGELIKVITGIRRSGKSVMLELIKDELAAAGVGRESVVSINFEDMRFARLLTARALHDEIASRVKQIEGKAYLFFDEIQEVADWEKCVNSFRVEFDCDIYITGLQREAAVRGARYLSRRPVRGVRSLSFFIFRIYGALSFGFPRYAAQRMFSKVPAFRRNALFRQSAL